MKEKLIIKNFGPIKSVELDLGRFTVLIGDQGTGKSTVAKVLATIYSLWESTGGGKTKMMQESQLSSLPHFKKHLSVYEINNYLKWDTVIRLYGKEIDFHLEKEVISFNYDELIKKNFSKTNSVTYIPADRIATSLFSAATWTALIDFADGRVDALDMPKYFLRFINLFERLKKTKEEYDFTEILGIKFRQDNGIDKIVLNDGTTISVNESSSAIQSNLSLCTIIDWQSEIRDENTHTTFLIEEPELNLFPATQQKLMQYLVNNTILYKNHLLLTTHSPYVLTSLNNLMYAYRVGQLQNDEANRIIEKNIG